jgi:hypothetical protein
LREKWHVEMSLYGNSAVLSTEQLGYSGEHKATLLTVVPQKGWPMEDVDYYLHFRINGKRGHIAGPLGEGLKMALPQGLMKEGYLTIQVCAVKSTPEYGEVIVKSASATGRILPGLSEGEIPLEEKYDGLLYDVLQEVKELSAQWGQKMENGELVGPKGEPGPPGAAGPKGEKGDPGEGGITCVKANGTPVPPDSTGAVNITAASVGAVSELTGSWTPQLISADGGFTATVNTMTSWWSRLGALTFCCFKIRLTNCATTGSLDSPVFIKGFPGTVARDGMVSLPYCSGLKTTLDTPVFCQTVGGAICQSNGASFRSVTAGEFVESESKIYLGGFASYQIQA